MAFTEQDAQADIASYQPPADKTAEPHPLATPAGTPPDPIAAAQTPPPAQVTPSYLDGVLSFADKYKSRVHDIFEASTAMMPFNRPVRDLASGAIKGGAELVDSAKSLLTAGPAVSETADENGSLTATEDKTPASDPFHPIYDDARKAILGVRDAIAVKDPTLTDELISGFGQFAGPWAAYSRILGSLGWAARAASIPEAGASFGARILAKGVDTAKSLPRLAAVDAAVNATANAPHDPRTADLFSLHNTAEGKFHDMLNTVSPDGSLVRHYIDYVANPDGSEAENRWKNVLDGFNVGAAVGGVFHVAAGTFRAGWGALHYMADNNMGSMSDLMPANQEGKIGYHGTPHDFDTAAGFQDEKIGSGQGAASFGVGHYIAENKATGQYYREALSMANVDPKSPLGLAQKAVDAAGGDRMKAYVQLARRSDSATDLNARSQAQQAAAMIKSGAVDRGRGSLVRTEIDDKHIDNMLDWDKPLKEQAPSVKNALVKAKLIGPESTDTGGDLMHQMGLTAETSKTLGALGIPGVKYLDEGSRTQGEGTRNFVVFNGKHVKILGKE